MAARRVVVLLFLLLGVASSDSGGGGAYDEDYMGMNLCLLFFPYVSNSEQ